VKKKCSNCNKVVHYEDDNLPILCPYCEVKYWEMPKNERVLHKLQDQYLETRKESILGEMALIMKKIIKNLVIKKLKESGSYNSQEELEDVVYDSLLKIINYYQSKPDFSIEYSFVGYLSQIILYPLYNAKKKERQSKEISMQTEIGHEGKTITLEDRVMKFQDDSYLSTEDCFFQSVNEVQLITSLSEFLEEVFYIISDKQGLRTAIINWSLVNHYLEGKNERFFNHCWEIYDNSVRDNYEFTLSQLREFLLEESQLKETDIE